MSKVKRGKIDDSTHYSSFSSDVGCEEVFITFDSLKDIDFDSALQQLADNYHSALNHLGLTDSTAVFSRLYVSDFINQQGRLAETSWLKRLRNGGLSIIEQKPVDGGPVSLYSSHIRAKAGDASGSAVQCEADGFHNTSRWHGKNYTLLFTANHTSTISFDAYAQTNEIFKELAVTLEESRMRLLDNTIRTWIYVRDVDNHYAGLVRGRREFFTLHGLTNATRYLASTGIEGSSWTPDRIVSLDSLSIGALQPQQIIRMEAPTHLSPTILYGVTFERGLRVRFGDRSHLYISGTASINDKGDVLYLGDAVAQTRRTIENLKVLLTAQNASLDDLVYLLVYVRNVHEWKRVETLLHAEIGTTIPLVAVEAKVCRPAWLFELEGVAIVDDENDFPVFK